MSRIRVAHIINGVGLGGVTVTVSRLLRALSSGGYDRLVCALKPPGQEALDSHLPSRYFGDHGIDLTYLSQERGKFHLVGDLCRWLIQERVQILHTHSYNPNLYGRLAGVLCKTHRLRLIAHYHSEVDDKWAQDNSFVYDKLLASFTDRLLVPSESLRSYLAERLALPAGEIEILPGGVDIEAFSAPHDAAECKRRIGFAQDDLVVGMVGRISEEKGQEDFLAAAGQVRRLVPNSFFCLIGSTGSTDFPQRLRRQIDDMGITKAVRFLGHHSDMPRVYAALDVVVVPSRREGFGLVLLEAMAAGKPIVAANVGAIPAIVIPGITATLVPPRSPVALASEIVWLLSHPEAARVMGRNGKERARSFSWEAAAQNLDRLYQDLAMGNMPTRPCQPGFSQQGIRVSETSPSPQPVGKFNEQAT
jgi:glycosyltransferase involved in cell wall biosynthesis